jgi:hypothetical protein
MTSGTLYQIQAINNACLNQGSMVSQPSHEDSKQHQAKQRPSPALRLRTLAMYWRDN